MNRRKFTIVWCLITFKTVMPGDYCSRSQEYKPKVKLCQVSEADGNTVFFDTGGVPVLVKSRCTCNLSIDGNVNDNQNLSVEATALLEDPGHLKLTVNGQAVNVSKKDNSFPYTKEMRIVFLKTTTRNQPQCYKLNGVKDGHNPVKMEVKCDKAITTVSFSTPSTTVLSTTTTADISTVTSRTSSTTVLSTTATVTRSTNTSSTPISTSSSSRASATYSVMTSTEPDKTFTSLRPPDLETTTELNNTMATVNNTVIDGITNVEIVPAAHLEGKDEDGINIGIVAGLAAGALVVVVAVTVTVVVCKRRRQNENPDGNDDSARDAKDPYYDMTMNANYVSADNCRRETTTPGGLMLSVTEPDTVLYSVVNKHARQPKTSATNMQPNKNEPDTVMYSVANKHARQPETSATNMQPNEGEPDTAMYSAVNKHARQPKITETSMQVNEDEYNRLHEVARKPKPDNGYNTAGISIAGLLEDNTDNYNRLGDGQKWNAQENLHNTLGNE